MFASSFLAAVFRAKHAIQFTTSFTIAMGPNTITTKVSIVYGVLVEEIAVRTIISHAATSTE